MRNGQVPYFAQTAQQNDDLDEDTKYAVDALAEEENDDEEQDHEEEDLDDDEVEDSLMQLEDDLY